MKSELTREQLRDLDLSQLEDFLTSREKAVLATEHIAFSVNVPVTVSIVRDTGLKLEPFWLREQGFRRNGLVLKNGRETFDIWDKDFSPGRIGLGVNSLSGGEHHYFILVQPRRRGDAVQITSMRPAQLRIALFEPGVKPYLDRDETLETIPPELQHRLIIRTAARWAETARLLRLFRWTEHPSSARPDHPVLTWSEDPRTTQTIQWRTAAEHDDGFVAFQKKALFWQLGGAGFQVQRAKTKRLVDRKLLNDPAVCWHTATLRDLEPGTTYLYTLGNGQAQGWIPYAEFTTAPAAEKPFSFVYLGDAQNGLDRWGVLLRKAFSTRPDAAFYVMAGDLVNWGFDRSEWDSLFQNASGVFDRRPVLPAIGNHDCLGGGPGLYLQQFSLPDNGPLRVASERAYAFEYSNALFLVLDSNLRPGTQTAWMEEQLARSKAKWKFVVYHHPAFSSANARDNAKLREAWTPIFDRYHVDMALQGHDHAYMRTYPMRAGKPVGNPAAGTVYVVSVSGTKRYAQEPHPYTAVGMTNVATYQVIDVSPHRLNYQAFDIEGRTRDQLVIVK